MRFLCFHGRGTSAKIFEMQTARLRQELDDHEFIFIDGPVATEPGPGANAVSDEYYGYFGSDFYDLDQHRELLAGLVDFVGTYGPFDGVMGFSEGAVVAAMLLVEDERRPFGGFRCGVLFSAVPPLDPDGIASGVARCVDAATDGVVLSIPTAHIWSNGGPMEEEHQRMRSPLAAIWAQEADAARLHESMVQLCDERNRQVCLHDLGHDVPGARSARGMSGAVRAIERTIEAAREQTLQAHRQRLTRGEAAA
ncbi:serine hydrolase FSH [Xylariales sp. AK1849]|nr:serine hydrolase FSH [Xylariales sp. AK1849]